MEFALTSPRGNAGAEDQGPGRPAPAPAPQSAPGLLASYQPSPKWATTSASSKGPSSGTARQGRGRGLLCGAHSQGFLGIHHLKAGETCNFIPWEEEPEKSASGVGMKWGRGEGESGRGSCSGRGGTWLGLPSLLHSPNFHQTLGPRLPETKTQHAVEQPRAARRGGRTRGGTEPREADATFPLRKPPGRTAVRTQ